MNILFYTNFSPYGKSKVGGAEISLKTLAEMMATQGHQSVFVTQGGSRFLKWVDKKTINQVQVYTLYKFKLPVFNTTFFKRINKLVSTRIKNYLIKKILKKHKITVVHAHYNLGTCSYFLKLRENNRLNYKFVMRFAGMLWYEDLKKHPHLLGDYAYIFEKSDAINFVSEGLYQLYNKACGENGYQFTIQHSFILDIGTNLKQLPEIQYSIQQEREFTMVMASRFTDYQKRQDLLVAAVAEIKGKVPFKLYLIGSGPTSEIIEKKIEEKSLSEQVKIIPFLPQNELWDFLSDSDLLCHACEYEGSSKIIIESMGMGLPVLASNVIPLNNYIVDNKTGFLINNTPKDWAKKIIEIYSNRDTLPEISKNAREYIKANYDSNKNIDQYEEIFAKLVGD